MNLNSYRNASEILYYLKGLIGTGTLSLTPSEAGFEFHWGFQIDGEPYHARRKIHSDRLGFVREDLEELAKDIHKAWRHSIDERWRERKAIRSQTDQRKLCDC